MPADWVLNRLGNPFVTLLLRSPFHGMLSDQLLLITVTGRRSGRRYTTPANYQRDNGCLWIVSRRRRTWWRNLRGGAPVTLLLKGKRVGGRGEVQEEPSTVASQMGAYIARRPAMAPAFAVTLDNDGRPRAEDLQLAAESRVMVRIVVVAEPAA